jgi:uncharacterized membrane protein YfcA
MIHAALAWGGAVIIGVSLGLLGSGGSILTVPVLVYLFGQDEKLAIAGSLAVVGLIAGVGAGAALRRGQFNVRAWLSLAAPGLGGAALGAWASHLVSGRIQLGTFALIMLAAGAAMLRRPADALPTSPPAPPHTALPLPLLLAIGAVLGVITGFVGVGGGFLVVPALVVAARLAPRIATGRRNRQDPGPDDVAGQPPAHRGRTLSRADADDGAGDRVRGGHRDAEGRREEQRHRAARLGAETADGLELGDASGPSS